MRAIVLQLTQAQVLGLGACCVKPHDAQATRVDAKLWRMAEIHIHRAHTLGRDAALQLARDWRAQAEQDWGLRCTVQADDQHIDFERSGLKGSLRVSDEAFELRIALGFLLSAYRGRIEAELQRRLDGWLGAA